MKVGDKVAVMSTGDLRYVSVIERETANFWIVNGFKYRKKDGYEAGVYDGYWIREATKEDCDRYQKDKMIFELKHQNWESFSLEELTDIVAFVSGFTIVRSPVGKE